MTGEVGTLVSTLAEGTTSLDDLELSAVFKARVEELKADGSIVVLELFTSKGFERIRCTSTGLQRGAGGTDACEWPAKTCVEIVDTIPCAHEDGEDEDEDDTDSSPTDEEAEAALSDLGIELGKGLTIKDGKLQLDTTGVTPNTYAGMEVDDCGRIVSVSDKFPLRLPIDPCCKSCGAPLEEE